MKKLWLEELFYIKFEIRNTNKKQKFKHCKSIVDIALTYQYIKHLKQNLTLHYLKYWENSNRIQLLS